MLAGINYSLFNTFYGIGLSIRGYGDKQQRFLEKILDTITAGIVDPLRFDRLKEKYTR